MIIFTFYFLQPTEKDLLAKKTEQVHTLNILTPIHMKKFILLSTLLFVAGLSYSLIQSSSPAAYRPAASSTAIPDDVMAIFKKSCAPCHFDGGGSMALANLNFSAWEKLPAKKQVKKAAAICEEVAYKKMPPAGFMEANPDKVPGKEEAEIICKWAKGVTAP